MNINKLKLPNELAFLRWELDNFTLDNLTEKFTLLNSSYMDEIWIINGLRYPINFRIQLPDGSLLTEQANSTFLLELKCWIAIQQVLPGDKAIEFSVVHTLKRIRHVLRIIDYFLLSDYAQTIVTYGLSALTGNAFQSLAYRLSEYNSAEDQFYDWNNQIRAHLVENFSQDFSYGDSAPVIAVENFEELRSDFSLDLTDTQILNIRRNLYLDKSGHLKRSITRPKALINEIHKSLYRNTLYGHNLNNMPAELKIVTVKRTIKEKLPAPIRSTHNQIVKQNFRLYISCMKSLEGISQYGLSAPAHEEFKLLDSDLLANLGRSDPHTYKSIPFSVGLFALRGALEYSLEYAEGVLDAMFKVIQSSHCEGTTIDAGLDITPYVSEKLLQAGVRRWTILAPHCANQNFTEDLRKMTGLYETFIVLIGALQVILGIMLARRYKEIQATRYSNVDTKNNEISFLNGKSGFGEKRITLSRPIPPVCIRLLRLLAEFHHKLFLIGLSEPDAKLLSLPNRLGSKLKSIVHREYYEAVDLFCDYIQLPTNEAGQRYYLREHQLRRFFAQAFFWSSLGNIHTLRWMLGHTDPEHVYRYISDSVPGQVLRGVKADFLTEIFFRHEYKNTKLEALIEHRFNTSRFSILVEDEVREYLEVLISEKQVKVEPHYYRSEEGNSYQFIIEVSDAS